MNHNKGFVQIIILIFLAAITVGGVGYYIYINGQARLFPVNYQEGPSSTPTVDITSSWETYKNNELGFELKYPPSMEIVQEGWQRIGNDQKGMWILDISTKDKNEEFLLDYRVNPKTAGGTMINNVTQSVMGIEYTEVTFEKFPAINYESVNVAGDITKGLNILKGNSLWAMRITHFKGRDTINLDRVFSTFKFTELTDSHTPTLIPTKKPGAKTYIDSDLGYSITYPSSWTFRRTYGKDIPKEALENDILDGFDLNFPATTYNDLSFAGVVLDAHGLTDIQEWIDKYDPNYPKNSIKKSINFNGRKAIKFSFINFGKSGEYIYFINGNYIYRLMYWQEDSISETLHEVVNSFRP